MEFRIGAQSTIIPFVFQKEVFEFALRRITSPKLSLMKTKINRIRFASFDRQHQMGVSCWAGEKKKNYCLFTFNLVQNPISDFHSVVYFLKN
jgi:hypothetical protein